MIQLTVDEAAEIYAALETKFEMVSDGQYGTDEGADKWEDFLEALMEKIGMDGRLLLSDQYEEELIYVCPKCNQKGLPSIYGNLCTSCSNIQRFGRK